MRINKRTSALLIAFITALALSACGGAPEVPDASEPQTQGEPVVADRPATKQNEPQAAQDEPVVADAPAAGQNEPQAAQDEPVVADTPAAGQNEPQAAQDEPVVADEPVAVQNEPQTAPGQIRTTAGEGVTPGGALWSVALDDFTDERLAFVVSPTESSSSLYEPHLVFGCGEDGAVFIAWFQGLPVSDTNDRYTVTIRWDSLAAQTFSANEHGDRMHRVDNPALYRRNVINHDMLRVRFEGYSDSVTATIDVSAMRNAPTWPNILACGN